MMREEDVRKVRIAIYFDCIVGISIATYAIIAIIAHTAQLGIQNPITYALGLGFWIFILGLAFTLIYVGIHTYYLEKKYPEGIPTKKPFKAPFVS